MDCFVYKEVSRLIENVAKEGIKEFYSSMIREKIDVDLEDYFKIVEVLEEGGVIKRKFITKEDVNGNYTTIPVRELGNYSPEEVYVKYDIKEEFIQRIKED